jgi:replicative DNA helicase
LQLLARGGDYRNSEFRHNVSQFASDLRALACTLQSPILAISSQSREGGQYGNGGGSANLASLKESGELEYGADVVMVLVPSSKRQCTPPARAVDLHVVKNRYGDLGMVPLVFRADTGSMREEAKL